MLNFIHLCAQIIVEKPALLLKFVNARFTDSVMEHGWFILKMLANAELYEGTPYGELCKRIATYLQTIH